MNRNEYREAHACKVCQAMPDEEGIIEHGRGCYTVSEDGGGESSVETYEEWAARQKTLEGV